MSEDLNADETELEARVMQDPRVLAALAAAPAPNHFPLSFDSSRPVRAKEFLLDAADEIVTLAPTYFGFTSTSDVVNAALVEFIQRWIHALEIPPKLLEGHVCPACGKTTYLVPLAHPGLITYIDAGHTADCHHYRQGLRDGLDFRKQTLGVETDLRESRSETLAPGMAIHHQINPTKPLEPEEYVKAYYQSLIGFAKRRYDNKTHADLTGEEGKKLPARRFSKLENMLAASVISQVKAELEAEEAARRTALAEVIAQVRGELRKKPQS